MRTSDFDYDLPEEFIAQRPARPRDCARLLVLDRQRQALSHHVFRDLPGLLDSGDLLVLNETRVIPARIHARKAPGGGRVEILLLKRRQPKIWEALVGGKGLIPGRRLCIDSGPLVEVLGDLGGSRRVLRFSEPITPTLERLGEMPLPPYIHTPLRSPDEYQTVFAKDPGAAAAPTAGLHFTGELMDRLKARGISIAKITLHIGIDTFLPVTEEDPEKHEIHTEWCRVPKEVSEAVQRARSSGGRVIAVGTTTVRALETSARREGRYASVTPFEGATDLYILPGFAFQVTDAMITNFHLPRSTLLMMVSAFAGRERILAAYEVAKAHGYRFYSFGDAMLLL